MAAPGCGPHSPPLPTSDPLGVELQAAISAPLPGDPAARRALRHRLRQGLRSPAPTVRATAAAGLGRVGDGASLPDLLQASADRHPLVRWHAAHALIALVRGGLVAPTLLTFADEGAFTAWQDALLAAVEAALTAPDPAARHDAILTLAAIGAPASLPALAAALADPEPPLRRAAHAAVVALVGGDPARYALAAPPLHALLHTADPAHRRAATLLLGDLGQRAAVAYVEPLLHDVSAGVRAAAAHTLGQLADPASVRVLLAALVDDAPAVRRAAALALGRLADPYAAPALRACAADPDPTVRQAVAEALAGPGGGGSEARGQGSGIAALLYRLTGRKRSISASKPKSKI